MNKQAILLGIALMLLFTGIALATTLSASTDVIIYAFGQRIGFRLKATHTWHSNKLTSLIEIRR